jgi:putative oxidoreductase
MFAKLRKPQTDFAALMLRLGLAAVFIAHGYIKVRQYLSWTDVIPREMQQVVGWTELLCGVALLIGLMSRLAAVGIGVIMVGAIYYMTGSRFFIDVQVGLHGFTYQAAGFEYNVVILAMCLAVIALGSGVVSLDHFIFRPRKKVQPPAPMTPVNRLPEWAFSQR